MAFGQASGPAATARQVQELLELLKKAGHVDFRDARGPMGFSQRQAAGRFTRDEATSFIERLQEEGLVEPSGPVPAPAARAALDVEPAMRRMSDGQLAAELRRRGWVVSRHRR